jgi:hypothetical protein
MSLLIIISVITLAYILVTIDPLNSRKRITNLIKVNHPKFPVYNGILENGKLIKLQCSYGYLQIFVSVKQEDIEPTRCVYSQYMEERAHNCQVGFDDAIYFLKKAGFDISNTKFHYHEV